MRITKQYDASAEACAYLGGRMFDLRSVQSGFLFLFSSELIIGACIA